MSLLSSMIAVFSGRRRISSVTVFILSLAGIMALINAGYISFILIFGATLYYSINKITGYQNSIEETPAENNVTFLIITSAFGAILASVSGANMWQGKVFLKHDITLSNLLTNISFEYFIFFILIFSSVPLLLFFIKPKNEN